MNIVAYLTHPVLWLKDPCSKFSKVGILHVRPVEGHFWSLRSPKKKNFFLGGGGNQPSKHFLANWSGLAWPVKFCKFVKMQNLMKNKYHPIILGLVSIGLKEKN